MPSPDPTTLEQTPITRGEYIAAMVHFYRGELQRSTDWRLRLDTTTNWALLSVMGLLTFTLGQPSHPHAAILPGIALLATFHFIEARRFRIFDLWRARVRMIEVNFYGPILRRDLHSPVEGWGARVADDLMFPGFRISRLQALAARLRANYAALYLVLLCAWLLKLEIERPAGASLVGQMAVGSIPGSLVGTAVAAFYWSLVMLLLVVPAPAAISAEHSYFAGSRSAKEPLRTTSLDDG